MDEHDLKAALVVLGVLIVVTLISVWFIEGSIAGVDSMLRTQIEECRTNEAR